jgi:hypothetical protein
MAGRYCAVWLLSLRNRLTPGRIFEKGRLAIVAVKPLLVFGFDDRNLPRRDFTQGGDDFFVVRFDQRPGALEQLLGPACRSENQFESIRNVFEAIFYSYSSHRVMIFRRGAAIVNEGANSAVATTRRSRDLALV